jgi:hypothetical protein
MSQQDFSEFTEHGFRSLIQRLKHSGYRFALFDEQRSDRHVLWRHDVDYSLHRAAALAAIEADEGVRATYFLLARSSFYSLLEPGSRALVDRIAAHGHALALHFDGGVYGVERWTHEALTQAVATERQILELAIGRPVSAVSWHNPDQSNLLEMDAPVIAGLVNAYGGPLRETHTYGSDSNGYWRHAPMGDLIAAGDAKLHLLTHPEWWTPEAMSPSQRIDRAIQGRARRAREDYDALLARAGRRNLRD